MIQIKIPMKIKKSDLLDSLGISLLLLTSFYFFKFSNFAVPSLDFIILEILKVFTYLFFLNIVYLKISQNKFKKIFLFFFLIYVSIFLLKLLFTISGDISLHYFLKLFYSKIFNLHLDRPIPISIKILSYLTPYIFLGSFFLFFYKDLEKIKSFLVTFGCILSLIIFWDLFKIYEKKKIETKKINTNSVIENVNKEKKVLWLVYDALDPEYITEDKLILNNGHQMNGKKIFRHYHFLKNSSVFHENMYPPSNWTLYSMPSQLLGINIKNMIPKNKNLIFTDLQDKIIPFNFENTIFGKLNNKGLSVSLLSSVLEYCSAYLISNKWKKCEDLNSNVKSNSVFNESIRFYFSLFFKFKIYLNEFGILNIIDDNDKKIELIKKYPKKEFKDSDFDKIHSIEFKGDYPADHTNLINVDKIIDNIKESNLTFAHIYNPHLYGQSYVHIENKLKTRFKEEKYLVKLLYTDLFNRKLFKEIAKNNLNDLLIIISSDHWFRGKNKAVTVNGKDYKGKGNSFFIGKVMNDDNKYLINKESSNLVIPELIDRYFLDEINSNEDIFNYINLSDIKINTLIKD